MGLEKQFEVCFLVKKFDFETTSKYSKLATKPHVKADCHQQTARCPHSSSPKIKDENKKDNKSEEIVSYQVYKLPSLSRNYTPKEKKKKQVATPQVSIQGQKYFEEDEDNITGKLQCASSKSLSRCCKPYSVSSVDNVSLENSVDDGEEINKLLDDSGTVKREAFMVDIYDSAKRHIPGLEGRKVKLGMKLSDERTLKRIERLKTLRTEEHRVMKEFYFPNAQQVNYKKLVFKQRNAKDEFTKVRKILPESENKFGENSAFSYNFFTQERHKNRIRCTERKLIELPRVESYDILTPRKIIASDVCHVFRESTVAKETASDSNAGVTPQNDKNKQWKKAILNEVFGQTNVVEMRNPSPVHGLKLNPKKELEAIDKALKLVEESNSAEERKLEFEEKQMEISVPIQKFVIHLPSIC